MLWCGGWRRGSLAQTLSSLCRKSKSWYLMVHLVSLPAGLMPKDELDMIINDMRPIMKAAQPGVPDTWDNLYAFFLNRVRDNLHVMLCFSPVGNKFSTRAQQFPGLINGCTIDWFLPWPEEALTSGES